MARIRTIKPDFWTDEKIVELSFPARLAFIGLWNQADDYGRMEYKPASLKLRIFPADRLDFDKLVRELEAAGMVQVYEAEGRACLQVANFDKHQKVDHRSDSKLPPPPTSTESPRIPPIPPSGREGKGMEKEGREARSRALPPDFQLDEKRATYAREQGVTNPAAVFAHFRDHHTAKGTTLRDWDAGWRTWVRNELKFGRGPNRADPPPPPRTVISDTDRARAQAALKREAERAAALSAPVSEDAKAKAQAWIADLAAKKAMPR